jgi:hypothetical protein
VRHVPIVSMAGLARTELRLSMLMGACCAPRHCKSLIVSILPTARLQKTGPELCSLWPEMDPKTAVRENVKSSVQLP